jgi:hypothetical protein
VTSYSDAGYPKRQRENLLEQLLEQLREEADEESSYFAAFRTIALKLLGYENSATVVDGPSDRGLDAYRISGSEVDIFQFKSQDFTKKIDDGAQVDPKLLDDVKRIVSFLQATDFAAETSNKLVKKFIYQLQTAIQSAPEDQGDFVINIRLVTMYDSLTPQAKVELDLIKSQASVIRVFGREVLVDVELVDLNTLLAQVWRETNTKWVDVTGQASEWITIQFHPTSGSGYIGDRSTLVTFGRARDLIDAYRRFGYQIFESNVRCEIAKSSVNDAIRAQVSTEKGIDEFRLLNNGITIICNTRKQPTNGHVEIHQPQVVNGLQTVTSLSEAYAALSPALQAYFDDHCFVLMRIYDHHAVSDMPKLVKATNNQNKMEPRNLVSNDPDQISFERSFAKLGWFYERKDFAWLAFDKAETQWSSLKGYKSRDFKVISGKAGRPFVRRVDNQEVAQHWLSFIGYVEDAAQRRKLIFDDQDFYSRIFRTRVKKHAFDYGFEFKGPTVEEDQIPSAPSADALLLAHLTYRLAKESLIPTAKLRTQLIEEHRWSNLSDDEINRRLTLDPAYVTGLALNAGPFLFVEMCGLIFLRAFGAGLYNGAAKALLERTDLAEIYRRLDYEPIKRKIGAETYEKSDLFCALWLLFKDVVKSELAESEQWTNAFLTESSKPRIMYRVATRRRILERVLDLDQRAEKRALNYDFSLHVDNIGILNYVRSCVTEMPDRTVALSES